MTEKPSSPGPGRAPSVPRYDFDDDATIEALVPDDEEQLWQRAREAAQARDEHDPPIAREYVARGSTPPPSDGEAEDDRSAELERASEPQPVAPPAPRPPAPRLPGLPPRVGQVPVPPAAPGPSMIAPPLPAMPMSVRDARAMQDSAPPYVARSRTWSFVLDETGQPIELGSGRFAKAFLGEERWVESKTAMRRPVAIKCLQRGVGGPDRMRFQIEKEILERVQGHPNIVELLASGEGGSPGVGDEFIPPVLRDKLENDFVILELLDASLEELVKGARQRRRRDDLLAMPSSERIFRVLDYVLPIATAVEFAHLVRNVCHRDIKPANILVKLPDPRLRGSQMKVKLADFNVGKVAGDDVGMTRVQPVPGTLFFQSPEQETNSFELLVNCTRDSAEVEFFEDFYIDVSRNDTFSLFNREQHYQVVTADRARKKILLDRPFAEADETNVRGRIVKAVGRPADVYSLGALLYYLISGATGNPKTLFDNFKRFAEYERDDDANTVAAYIEHEYRTIHSLRAPKPEQASAADVAYEDRFFSYKQYLDGNGELIDSQIMLVIAKAMIRNKLDSYCLSYDLESAGISAMVHDLLALYVTFGVNPAARLGRPVELHPPEPPGRMRRALDKLFSRRP